MVKVDNVKKWIQLEVGIYCVCIFYQIDLINYYVLYFSIIHCGYDCLLIHNQFGGDDLERMCNVKFTIRYEFIDIF